MKLQFLTTKEIAPRGWMRRQLELEAEGLCGNLDKVWADVRDSKWIGGDREGWERVPYWLDGFIPLAYLLKNEDMIARAKHYIDSILAAQCEDGWICPNGETPREKYDLWAIHLISKVLTVWYDCSEDARIPDVLYRIMKNFYDQLSHGEISVFNWAKFRWFEGFIALGRLAEWYPNEAWICELARLLKDTGTDYRSYMETWIRPLNKWTLHTHIVNIMMMLKSEVVSHELLGEEYTGLADELDAFLAKYNATPVGLYTGDECLSGISPIQGTELCAVVELMYSLEWLYAYTGDAKWAERLEKVAFNALPATITDDMWGHQYDQMSNQIDCTPFGRKNKPIFRTNGGDSHVFGLEPEFGCCTSNFGQGWPKLMLSSFMKAEDGLTCAVPIPAEVSLDWKGSPITVSLETSYPFRNRFVYRVNAEKKTGMKLHIRVPSFAKHVTVNGKAVRKKAMLTFGGFAAGETVIEIAFEAEARLMKSPIGLYNAAYGSLVFSLPVAYEVSQREYVKNDIERKFPYCDYDYKGVSDWNCAYTSRNLHVEERDAEDDIPFSSKHPVLVLRAELCHIDWGYAEGYETVCAKLPESRKPIDAPVERVLYPYGCAKLRMTEMPIV